MLQIKKTLLRNLDAICEEHYNELNAFITAKIPALSIRQRDFIGRNLKRILVSKPNELARVNAEFSAFCKAPGNGKIKNPNSKLQSVFNYKWFTKTNATYYCGYDLAKKLNVKSCPYCNRNYTVTVSDGKRRIVRPDFDHFLPNGQYPLLALSFYNLIPSCLICNRTVKNKAKIVYGKYLHPYEDGYGATLKINYFANDTDSSVGLNTDYEIHTIMNPLEPAKAKMCLENFKLFKLREIYKESHNAEIAEIIRKYYISNGRYLETLKNAFPSIGGIDELYRLAFGSYYAEDDFEKRPLSKMTKDVVEQLVFIIPGLTPV